MKKKNFWQINALLLVFFIGSLASVSKDYELVTWKPKLGETGLFLHENYT
jgi:hypothetical protein